MAQWIAERAGADILSADSMLVYRGMDIGTAKPGVAERSRVRHWGIDLVDPWESFSAAAYRKAAMAAIDSATCAGRKVIVVGGTGLYIKVLVDGIADGPAANAAIRSRAQRVLSEFGVEAIEEWLKSENKALYDALADKRNPRRLIRALERAHEGALGGVEWRPAGAGPLIPGLRFPPAQLARRIERRARRMFDGGLLEEVERLLTAGLDSAPTARHAIGYAEAIDCIRRHCSIDEAVAKTVVRTRQLAKRQNTWFRGQANVQWLDCDESMQMAEVAEMVRAVWKRTGPTPLTGYHVA